MKAVFRRPYTVKLVIRQRRAVGLHDYEVTIHAFSAREAIAYAKRKLAESEWVIPRRARKPYALLLSQCWEVRSSVRRATGSGQTIPVKKQLWATSGPAAKTQFRSHMERGGFIVNKIIVRKPDAILEAYKKKLNKVYTEQEQATINAATAETANKLAGMLDKLLPPASPEPPKPAPSPARDLPATPAALLLADDLESLRADLGLAPSRPDPEQEPTAVATSPETALVYQRWK